MKGHNKGTKPIIAFIPKPTYQYKYILKTIKELKLPLDKVAILSRNNSFLSTAEDFFNEHNIPNVFLNTIEDFQTTKKKNHLVISTFHKSKGLEWDVVFILGLDDKYFPNNLELIEEERRLFFVGATRAKTNLYFVISTTPTRFLKDILKENIDFYKTDYNSIQKTKNIDERPERTEQSSLTIHDIKVLKPELNNYDYKTIILQTKIKVPQYIITYDMYLEFMYFLTFVFNKALCDTVSISEGVKGLLYTTKTNDTYTDDIIDKFNNNVVVSDVNTLCNNLNIKPTEVRTVKYNILKHYFEYYQQSLIQYKNNDWEEVLRATFNLAICECVSKRRNKGLYLDPYNEWISNIKNELVKFVNEIKLRFNNIKFTDNQNCLSSDNCIVLFKYSLTNSLKGEWVVELKKLNKKFNKKYGIIINPFTGTIEKIKFNT
jgi:hypothetical protein